MAAVFAGLVLAQAGAGGAAGAQSPRRVREQLNAWLNVAGELEVARRWAVDYDVSLRRHGPVDDWQGALARAGVRFQPLPALRLTWGYAFAESWPYGKLPAPFAFPEHRMWEQLQLQGGVGRVAMTHRYRLEQRWLGRVAAEGSEERVQNWVRSNRLRYRMQGTIPLRGPTLDDGEFYLNVHDELFVAWGANVQANLFDQNRLSLSLGRRSSRGFRAEAGYLQQLLLKGNGRELERNHTLVVTLYPNVTLKR